MADLYDFSTAPAGGESIETRTNLTTAAVNVSSAADGTNMSCWIDYFQFTNTTTAAVTVTVTETTTSIDYLTAVSLGANSVSSIYVAGGQFFSGGVTWKASANGVNGYARGLRLRHTTTGQ